MKQLKHDRFKRGSGCFVCRMCQRQSRDTGDNGQLELCPECYEIATLENSISDYGDPDGKLAQQVEALTAQCKAKGGKL